MATKSGLDRRDLLVSLVGTLAIGDTAAATEPPTAQVPRLAFAYEATILLAPDVEHGRTPYGGRTRAPIVGGQFAGPGFEGRVLPGGADWQLLRADGYFVLDAEYFMEATDGTQIRVRNKGLWHSTTNDWPADYAFTTPEFEVPIGRHDWLNRHVFVGPVGQGRGPAPAVIIRVYKVS
jgi:hypothetical protein